MYNTDDKINSAAPIPYQRRTTRPSVRFFDKLAKWVICTGGISVTVAFAAIVACLASVALPLFAPTKIHPDGKISPISPIASGSTAANSVPAKFLATGLDEEATSLWTLDAGGSLMVRSVESGKLVRSQSLELKGLSAFQEGIGSIAIGQSDGTARVGRIVERSEYLPPAQFPDAAESLKPGQTIIFDERVGRMTPANQLRLVKIEADLSDPMPIGEPASPITLIAYQSAEKEERVVALRADGRLIVAEISLRRNMLTGKQTRSVESYELPPPPNAAGKTPKELLLGLNGTQVYLIFSDGWVARYNTQDLSKPILAEERNLLPGNAKGNKGDLSISMAKLLLGDTTVIVADSRGGVSGWFPTKPADGVLGADGQALVQAHQFRPNTARVIDIALSSRDRQFLTLGDDGQVLLRHMTSDTTQGEMRSAGARHVEHVKFSPKANAVALLDESGSAELFSVDNPHADGSFAQLFGKLHYEGYAAPGYVYQSSAGTQDAELKLSLVPLIFGTLKATFYAMLFAVPIAILAAIYTSEFMTPRFRSVVKPAIELMASLPSVVLGFIGALVLSPIVESNVLSVLLFFIAVPLGLVLAGMFWQLLPPHAALRIPIWLKFLMIAATTVLAAVATYCVAPVIEWLLFQWIGGAPSFRDWLAHWPGSSATPGWVIVLLLPSAVALTMLFDRYLRPMLPVYRQQHRRRLLGITELSRFAGVAVLTLAISWAAGAALGRLWDLRGSVFGPYVQRNSLMVGLMMGFAIIPIIYTVSEDALSSVPSTLRSASLGAGATPWQTALRVVLPVATSGIFSACMIGFGRAAGETMIVMMLSGRTPIIDLNIFNGLSALSANIATELPEAATGTTHYRVLFMSTLVLFVITFVVNTGAELVRMRFRKRAYQL